MHKLKAAKNILVALMLAQFLFSPPLSGVNRSNFIFKKIACSRNFSSMGIEWSWGVTVDHLGYAYIMDNRAGRVVKLDRMLNFDREFCSAGPGTGQVSLMISVSVDSCGQVYVMDNGRKLVHYSSSGLFVREIPTGSFGIIGPARIIAGGFFFGSEIVCPGLSAKIFDVNRRRICSAVQLQDRDLLLKKGGEMTAVYPTFLGRHLFMDGFANTIAWAEAQNYLVRILDARGNRICLIKKKRDRQKMNHREQSAMAAEVRQLCDQKISDSAILSALKNYGFKNTLCGICLSAGLVYVFLVPGDISIPDPPVPVQVYDFGGRLIETGTFPWIPAKIIGNQVYVVAGNKKNTSQRLEHFLLRRRN